MVLRYKLQFGGRCRSLSALLVGAGAAVWLWRWNRAKLLRNKAKAIRRDEQEFITSQIETLSKEMDNDLINHVLNLSAEELVDELKKGSLNPILVLKIYLYKACQVTQGLNCVALVNKECFKLAESLPVKNRNDLPLYGLPVSVKESFQTKGCVSCVGLAENIENTFVDDCVIAKVLKHCGALPFVKTNVPQTMLSFESSNPVYGETSNPLNLNFAPGGSSAGESSIIAAGASLLGFGTDIAGSIRVPSHFCGICGLKPTQNRISGVGITSSLPGQSAISATLGPMARDVDTLVLVMRSILCEEMFELDRFVPPLRFQEEMYTSKEKMRIGYYEDDGYMEPVPSCKRAVRLAKEALERAGHTLVPYKIPDIEYMMDLASQAVYADGGTYNIQKLRYDRVDKILKYSWRRWTLPSFIRRIYAFFLNLSSPRMARDLMAYGGGDKSVARLWDITDKIKAYKAKFWQEWREKYKIDALICPVFPMVACPKGMVDNMTAWMSYTEPYNIVNCPAGSVPVTKVTEKDIEDLKHHTGHYGDNWDKHIKNACLGSVNMPVGVQCVTPPWHEERCLRLMKEIEDLV